MQVELNRCEPNWEENFSHFMMSSQVINNIPQ